MGAACLGVGEGGHAQERREHSRAPDATHPLTLAHPLSLLSSLFSGGGGHHDTVTFDGVTLHKAAGWHKALGSGLAGVMWCVAGEGGKGEREENDARRGGTRGTGAPRNPLLTPGSFFPALRFWIFYRFYHDGDVLLYGHAPHFEHDEGHSEEGGAAGGGHH